MNRTVAAPFYGCLCSFDTPLSSGRGGQGGKVQKGLPLEPTATRTANHFALCIFHFSLFIYYSTGRSSFGIVTTVSAGWPKELPGPPKVPLSTITTKEPSFEIFMP